MIINGENMKIITNNELETIEFGERLGKKIFKGAVVTLNGDLGAGKTTFTKGFARGLGITEIVNSPTYTILKIYEGKIPLYHIDAYRLSSIGYDYDLEEYIYGDGITVIEWSENIKDSIDHHLKITIEIVDEKRVLTLESEYQEYKKILENLNETIY